MTKVAFVSDWGSTPEQLLGTYKKQTPNNSGKWNKIVGIKDPCEADLIIALGRGHDIYYERFASKKIIQFRREPDFIRPFSPLLISDRIYDYTDSTFHVVTWKIDKSFSDLVADNYPNKNKKISCIVTDKYKNRIDVVRRYEAMQPRKMDVFGRFFKPESKNGINYKGQVFDKSKAYDSYEYSLVMENSQQRNYWTEKIVDAFLSWSVPIYWGCPNISEYFPENSYYVVDLSRPEDIEEILKKPIEKKNIDALREARNLILYEYNIWPTIQKIVYHS